MNFRHDGQALAVAFMSLFNRLPERLRPHAALLALLLPTLCLVYWLAAPAEVAAPEVAPIAATQATTPAQEQEQEEETAAQPAMPAGPVWHTYTVAAGDSLSSIFQQQGYGASTLHGLMALGKVVKPLAALRPGDKLRFQTSDKGELLAVSYALGDLKTLEAEQGAEGWQAHVRTLRPSHETVARQGKVAGPLSVSMRAAGIPSGMVADFIDIFHWKVDFRRDMRAGATFAVIYQKLVHDGKEVGQGPIEAAELTNAGETLRVYRYEDGKGGFNYYTADGRSLQPSILRTPVRYTRVSSTFSLHRWHPVLQIWRPHYGVDLAAPTGTPIKAAADGVVKYVGWSNGYGKLVELDNVGAYSTRYGHMSRFAKSLKKGDRVRQGEVIGYVGETGEATGPHLHFEIRVGGKPYDPLKVKLPDSKPLPKALMADFTQAIQPLLAVLLEPDSDSSRQRLAALDEQPLTTAMAHTDSNQGL
nr:Murein DD-endopeptidase MepM [uncultured bacterium]